MQNASFVQRTAKKKKKFCFIRKDIPKCSIDGPCFLKTSTISVASSSIQSLGFRGENKVTYEWNQTLQRAVERIRTSDILKTFCQFFEMLHYALRGIIRNTLSDVPTYDVKRYKATQPSGETSSVPATSMYYFYPFQNGLDIHAI